MHPLLLAARLRAALALLSALGLGACASLAPEAAFVAVERSVQPHLKQPFAWVRSDEDRRARDERVAALLAEPLGVDAAIEIALRNNRALQADFATLALADAERVQAGRWPNPHVSFARLTRAGEIEIERGLHIDLARWLTLPLAARAANAQLQQVQRDTAMRVIALAADTRKAWLHAVAADEGVRYAQQVMQAAEAGAELARRMQQVGNFNALQRAREQRFYAEAALQLARAEQRRAALRERLTRLMGLWGEQIAYRLPERLPDLPPAPRELADAESQAIAQRLDIAAARAAVEQARTAASSARPAALVQGLELGVQRNSSNVEPTQHGIELGIELPLFDWGGARVARAQAQLQQAQQRADAAAIDARSEVREAYAGYRHAWDIARHQRDEMVPLAQSIAEQNLLRYNGMLIGVFELLADARTQITSVNAAIDALRDFWLADADLQAALIGKPTLALSMGGGDGPRSETASGH
jgi:outer membrane protein TolC